MYAPAKEEALDGIEAEEGQIAPKLGGTVALKHKTNAVMHWKSAKSIQ